MAKENTLYVDLGVYYVSFTSQHSSIKKIQTITFNPFGMVLMPATKLINTEKPL